MKKSIFKTVLPLLAVALMGVVFATSCKKDKENAKPGNSNVSEISFTGDVSEISFTPCHDGADKGIGDPDSVVVNYSNGTVTVEHYNLTVSCDFTQVGTKVTQSNDTLRVLEFGNGGYANCICSTDHIFQINNIKGRWTIVLENSYPEYCQTYNFQ